MNKLEKLILSSLMCILSICLNDSIAYANAASTYGVDYMCTFDDIADWKGAEWSSSSDKSISINAYPNDFPVNGTESNIPWTGYAHYNTTNASGNWIANHGSANVWGGTGKSMLMNISTNVPAGSGGNGPDRLMTYFGNGTRTSGYNDIYVFYMSKIDPAQFPTNITNLVGTYTQGQPYAYYLWKFGGIAHGFVSNSRHADYGTPGFISQGTLYGWHQLLLNVRRDTANLYKVEPSIEGWYQGAGGDNDSGVHDNWSYHTTSAPLPLGEWLGIEQHLVLGTAGQDSGTYEVWIYDKNGNVIQAFSQHNLYLQHSKLAGDKFNKFWIGGNNTNTYSWGSGMVREYYIDDVIINGSRIGPKYFAKKLGSIPPPPPADTIPPAPPVWQ